MKHRPPRSAPSARDIAGRVVERVIEERAFSQHALTAALSRGPLHPGDRAFATRLTYLTLTWLRPIDAALEARLRKGLASLAPRVRAHLRVAAAQLLFAAEDVPSFAAVDEAVTLVRRVGGKGVGGLCNAVLRGLLRDGPPPRTRDGERWSLPDWLADLLIERRGAEGAEAAMSAWNEATPVHVRVRTGTRDEAIAALAADSIEAQAHPLVHDALIVRGGHPGASTALSAGTIAIQDAGAQLVALLAPRDARLVYDLCAGLGGKTSHLADLLPQATLHASDRHETKLRRLRESLAPEARDRVHTHPWDLPEDVPPALQPLADLVVVDAPCTALGTLGRHPEVRWTRSPALIAELAALQALLLKAAAERVRPGGHLVYATCTFSAAEGPDQVRTFLAAHPAWSLAPPTSDAPGADWNACVDDEGFLQLWPDLHASDGFFMARLRRADGVA